MDQEWKAVKLNHRKAKQREQHKDSMCMTTGFHSTGENYACTNQIVTIYCYAKSWERGNGGLSCRAQRKVISPCLYLGSGVALPVTTMNLKLPAHLYTGHYNEFKIASTPVYRTLQWILNCQYTAMNFKLPAHLYTGHYNEI